jgi:hypothetical protein
MVMFHSNNGPQLSCSQPITNDVQEAIDHYKGERDVSASGTCCRSFGGRASFVFSVRGRRELYIALYDNNL